MLRLVHIWIEYKLMQKTHLLEVVYFSFGKRRAVLRARSLWAQHFVWFAVERVSPRVTDHQVQDLTVKLQQQQQHLQVLTDAVHLFAAAVYGQFAWRSSLYRKKWVRQRLIQQQVILGMYSTTSHALPRPPTPSHAPPHARTLTAAAPLLALRTGAVCCSLERFTE